MKEQDNTTVQVSQPKLMSSLTSFVPEDRIRIEEQKATSTKLLSSMKEFVMKIIDDEIVKIVGYIDNVNDEIKKIKETTKGIDEKIEQNKTNTDSKISEIKESVQLLLDYNQAKLEQQKTLGGYKKTRSSKKRTNKRKTRKY